MCPMRVRLHQYPSTARPESTSDLGTRPWMLGSGCEPERHGAWGVAVIGGSGALCAGVSCATASPRPPCTMCARGAEADASSTTATSRTTLRNAPMDGNVQVLVL